MAKLKGILDVIEAYVYSVPGLNDEDELPGRAFVKQGELASPEWQQYQLEELQGAYLMVVLQYWTGNPTARTRVRQERFTRYVSVRVLCIPFDILLILRRYSTTLRWNQYSMIHQSRSRISRHSEAGFERNPIFGKCAQDPILYAI